MVKLLLKNGAYRNIVNKDGKTALTVAEAEYSRSGDGYYNRIADILKAN